MKSTANNDGLILNFALNYGGRTEIISACRQISEKVKEGKLRAEDITEEMFSAYLMTESLQDPDLLIRTSGEIRLSNFMLWQIAYSEFVFTDVLWPDFSDEHLIGAIGEYQLPRPEVRWNLEGGADETKNFDGCSGSCSVFTCSDLWTNAIYPADLFNGKCRSL